MPLEILILDDEPIVGQRLKAALEKEGHCAETFINPIQAVARLEDKTFDIVVTDIRMDDMDGIEILELVRKKGYSMLHLISDEEYQTGLQALERALENGPVTVQPSGGTLVWFMKP